MKNYVEMYLRSAKVWKLSHQQEQFGPKEKQKGAISAPPPEAGSGGLNAFPAKQLKLQHVIAAVARWLSASYVVTSRDAGGYSVTRQEDTGHSESRAASR